jgi:predicted metal-binding membrane protein
LIENLLRRDRTIVIGLIFLLFALAGFYTVLGVGMDMTAIEMTSMRDMRDMPGATAPGHWSSGYVLLVFLMWWVMMAAMMLPSVSPTVLLYSALLRRRSPAVRVPAISAAFLSGYLAIWAVFSAAATAAQWALEALGLVSATMMTFVDSVPGAIVLIAAGIFQFTSLKRACLQHCRSPAEFIARRKRAGVGGAFAMGAEHGVFCLGCCWFLMALLFVGGIMNLYWIVALAAFVALEKLTPVGEIASKVAGAALAVWGGWILVVAL